MIASVSASVDSRAAELIGTAIGERYRVDAIIGSGGMGTVVRAHDLRLKRDVAIKIMAGDRFAPRDLHERFEREAESVARLQHPNIVAILDFGSTPDGMKYQVMQLLEGRELAQALDGPFEPDRAVSLIEQVLRGLEHAHRQGVVHRDLKPQNVFLTRDPDGRELVRLLDFGLAKLVSPERAPPDGPALTLAGLAVGTPRYMSPEQGLGSAVDHRTDIYAAGVLLYEMLAGKPPFAGPGVVEIIRQHLVDDPPPLPDAVPPELQRIVQTMLAKSAADRYASATDVLDALARWRSPVVAVTPTRERIAPASRVAEPTKKSPPTRAIRRAPIVRAPLLAAALLCGLIVAWLAAPGATVHERIEMLSDRVAQLVDRITR